MSRAHRDQISQLLGAEPVLLQAADFGWIHRPRLYWGLDILKLISTPQKEGVEVLRAGAVAKRFVRSTVGWRIRASHVEAARRL